jgi:hypothetical protein
MSLKEALVGAILTLSAVFLAVVGTNGVAFALEQCQLPCFELPYTLKDKYKNTGTVEEDFCSCPEDPALSACPANCVSYIDPVTGQRRCRCPR